MTDGQKGIKAFNELRVRQDGLLPDGGGQAGRKWG